jgi:hypothetical protein
MDFIDSILYVPKLKLCQIWYNYEPDKHTKNYQLSLHTFKEQAFNDLVHAWESGTSVRLKETPGPAGISINQDMQHEMFKEPV